MERNDWKTAKILAFHFSWPRRDMEFNAAWGKTLYRENARLSPHSSACNCASTNQSGLSGIADLPH
jgi:hypothetical protein